MLLTSVNVMAGIYGYDFEVDGIRYAKINNTKVRVVTRAEERGFGVIFHDQYKGDIIIPTTVQYNGSSYRVTEIGEKAFEFAGITSISLPETITAIGPYAFYKCQLTSITLPESIDSIGNGAFLWCENLEKVNIPESVTKIGVQTFEECAIETIHIPGNVKSIGSRAFESCKNLHTITGMSGVTSIGEEAFYGCGKLEVFNMPSKMETIGEAAFKNCVSLTSIVIPGGTKLIPEECFSGCSQLKSLTLTEGVECILNSFKDCNALISVHIPSSLLYIGSTAFEYCRNLIEITVSMNNNYFDSRENSNAIISKKSRKGSYSIGNGWNAIFSYETDEIVIGCSGLNIPESVTSCCSLYGCYLPSVKLPKSLTKFSPLYDCYLGEVSVEEGNPVYDSRNNYNAIVITKSNTIHTVSSKTFIPEDIVKVEGDFRPYTEMKTLYCYASTPPVLQSEFTDEQFQTIALYVPKGCKNAYEKASGWDNFWNIKEFDTSGIDMPQTVDTRELKRYDINGLPIKSHKRGLNIIKMSDGSTRKVMVK